MSNDNPFEVSLDSYGDRSGADRDASGAEVSNRSLEMLNQTRPWVQLIGVLLWIGTVLMAIAGLFGLFAAVIAGIGGAAMFQGIFMLIFVLIYGTLAKSLTGYAKAINKLNASESVHDLEDALESQKTFWRLSGIITLVVLLIYLVMFLLMIAGIGFLDQMFGP